MKEPKVSIIMAVYNYKKHLKDSIDSILNQRYKNFEFIIVDGGSTDGTSEIIESYNDPKIIHKKLPTNIGFTPMLVHGVKTSEGEYIARHDADDISLPSRLSVQVEYFKKHPDIDILGTSYRVIDGNGKDIKNVNMNFCHDDVVHDLRYGSPFPHGSVMMKRCVMEDHGYDPEVEKSQDYDMWMRIASEGKYKFCIIPNILYHWRDHENSIGNTQWLNQFLYSERARLISEGRNNVCVDDVKDMINRTIVVKTKRRYIAHKYRRLFYITHGHKRIFYMVISSIFEHSYLIDGISKRINSLKYNCVKCIDYSEWSLCPNCRIMSVSPEDSICRGCNKDRLWWLG